MSSGGSASHDGGEGEEQPTQPVVVVKSQISQLLTMDKALISVNNCIGVMFQDLCEREECLSKSSTIVLDSVRLMKILFKLQEMNDVLQESLLKLAKIMTVYTKIGSEWAVLAAKLLCKLVKKTSPNEDILRFIVGQLSGVVDAKQNQKIGYYSHVLKMLMENCEVGKEFFMEALLPLMRKLMDKDMGDQGREYAITLGIVKGISFQWLLEADLYWIGLRKMGFLRYALDALESDELQGDMDKYYQLLVRRVSTLTSEEFDDFISILFEYLIHSQDKRNFKTLGVIVDLLEIVLEIVPPPLKSEITIALKSIDLWHVSLIVCFELFGEPHGEIIKKSDSTLPLELYLTYKTNSTPSESLIQRIYALKDDLTYKFCAIVFKQLFNIEHFTKFEHEIVEITDKVKALKSAWPQCTPRIRHLLDQELQRVES